MSKDSVKLMLEGLGFVVTEQIEDSEQPEGTVLFVEHSGSIVYAGDSYAQGTSFILHVSRGSVASGENGEELGE
jgi:beta-lactam-binding protein with PASTA domain